MKLIMQFSPNPCHCHLRSFIRKENSAYIPANKIFNGLKRCTQTSLRQGLWPTVCEPVPEGIPFVILPPTDYEASLQPDDLASHYGLIIEQRAGVLCVVRITLTLYRLLFNYI